jgi:hypothetical protein
MTEPMAASSPGSMGRRRGADAFNRAKPCSVRRRRALAEQPFHHHDDRLLFAREL